MRGSRSFLRHPGLAQTGEIGGLDQSLDLRHPEISDGPQAGEAGIETFAPKSPGLSELGGGALGLAVEAIGGGEHSVNSRNSRTGAARLYEPDDRLVGAGLQEVHPAYSPIEIGYKGIARAEADVLLCE